MHMVTYRCYGIFTNYWQDYYGQKRAEDLGHALIVVGFVSGTLVGFWKQSMLISVYFWLAGLGLTLLVTPRTCKYSFNYL